MMQIE